jgi:hypothetical protein
MGSKRGKAVAARLDPDDGQAPDLLEVRIARRDGQAVLACDRGDPDVVLRDWTAFGHQPVLDITVQARRLGIAWKNLHRRGERGQLSQC